MIDDDIRLDCVIRLTVPDAGFLNQVQIVAQRQFTQAAVAHGVRVVDDDFGADSIAVPVAVRENCANLLPVHVVLIHNARLVRNNHGLPSVRFQALRFEDVFWQTQFAPDASVRVLVLENPAGSQNRVVYQVAFARKICRVLAVKPDTVQPPRMYELRGISRVHKTCLL